MDAAVVIKLDDLAAPDDNTDLNATPARHGLLPKLDGNVEHVLRGDGTFGTVPSGGNGGARAGTTLAVFTDDPILGDTDDVIETYLGKQVTLPAYDAGKLNCLTVINAGTSASLIRAHNAPSIVKGGVYADVPATAAVRFLSSVAAPAVLGNKLTASFWIRVNGANTANRGIFHTGNGDTDGAASSFRLGITYSSSNAYLLVYSKNANAVTCNRRFPITQGVPHHVLIGLDLSAPSLQVFVDGVEVAYDTGLAGTTLTAAQPIGGSILPMRWLSAAAAADEFFGAIGQFALWQEVYGPRITERHVRSFYNDGPVDLLGSRINGVSPFVFLNALPTGSPLAIANAGTSGGAFTDQLVGGTVTALDTAGLDAPMLEQIDGFPAGYTLPVGTEVRLYRRSTKGVWGVF